MYLQDVALLFKVARIGHVSRTRSWMGGNIRPMGWAQLALPAAHVSAGIGPGPWLVMATAGVAWGGSQTPTSPCPTCAFSRPAPSPLPSRDPAPGSPLCQHCPLWCSRLQPKVWWVHLGSCLPHSSPCARCLYAPPFLLLLPSCLAGSSSRVFRVALLGLTPGAAEEPLAAAAWADSITSGTSARKCCN